MAKLWYASWPVALCLLGAIALSLSFYLLLVRVLGLTL
jgi:hypothetical protein